MLVRNKKLPLSLVKDAFNSTLTKGDRLLQVESYKDTFGPLSRRKRPTIGTSCMTEMMTRTQETNEDYNPVKDIDLHRNDFIFAKDEV